MITWLAKIFRGIHLFLGITASSAGWTDRAIVFTWLGILAIFLAFFAFLMYLTLYVF